MNINDLNKKTHKLSLLENNFSKFYKIKSYTENFGPIFVLILVSIAFLIMSDVIGKYFKVSLLLITIFIITILILRLYLINEKTKIDILQEEINSNLSQCSNLKEPSNVLKVSDEKKEPLALKLLEKELDVSSKAISLFGIILLCISLYLSFWLYYENKANTIEQITLITDINSMNQRLISKGETEISSIPLITFLILKSSANGALAITVLIILFRLSRSSFDQSIRYQKRYNSSLFLHYVFEEYKDKIKQNNTVSLKDVMDAFDVWNKTIESAFSSNNFSIEKSNDILNKTLETVGNVTKNDKKSN